MDSNRQILEIGVFSSAQSVAGQGVGSAYAEQTALLQSHPEDFHLEINPRHRYPLQHFHTIDPLFYLKMSDKSVNIAYCHFLPDTLDGSLRIPAFLKPLVSRYIVSFYNRADHLVVVNPSFIDELVRYGIDRSKIEYIPNFVSDKNFFAMEPDQKKALRKQWQIPQDRFVVLGCGQVQTRKGVKDFVETARRLPELCFVWAGGFSFGRLTEGYDELREIMEHPPENVRFLDIVPREKMNEIYNMSDLLFVPSYNELFPMTILEASSAGVPVLCRDLSLYEQILFDHYLKGSDNQAFAQIIDSLSKDGKAYSQAADHARQLSHFYSPDHVYSLWKDFYHRAYREKKPA